MNGYSSETALATSVESRPLDKQLEQLEVSAEQGTPAPDDAAVPADHENNNENTTDTVD